MTTFKISEKTLAAMPNMSLTKDEIENVAQAFGLRLLDWRRLTDQHASEWFVAALNQHGADHFFNALTRVRRLAGRERGFWLASISVVDPKQAPLLKNPPDASEDEVWRMAFLVFMRDEMNKTLQRLEKRSLTQRSTSRCNPMAAQTQEQRVAAAAGPENVKAQQNTTAMNAKVAQAAPAPRPAPRK